MVLWVGWAVMVGASGISVGSLRCEHLENPLGVEAVAPRLSWKILCEGPSRRGIRQTAYQIQVGTSRATLEANQPDLWDSGKVQSDRNVLVPYAGKALRSAQGRATSG